MFMAVVAEVSTVVLAEVSTETLAAGITLGLIVDSIDLIGDGAVMDGDMVMDGAMVATTTLGTVPTMEDFLEFITDLSTEMGLHPIIIEVEEIQALLVDDLNTIAIDLVSRIEAVILGQKLAADRAELVRTIEIVM